MSHKRNWVALFAVLLAVGVVPAVASAQEVQRTEGCDLSGQWLLVVIGTRCGEGGCIPQPYCMFSCVSIIQQGNWLQLCSRQVDGLGGALNGCCEAPMFGCLTGFLGCCRVVLSSDCCSQSAGDVIMTGKSELFGRILCGEFRQVVLGDNFTKGGSMGVDDLIGSFIVEGEFFAVKIGDLAPP